MPINNEPRLLELHLDEITADDRLQVRTQFSQEHAQRLADALLAGLEHDDEFYKRTENKNLGLKRRSTTKMKPVHVWDDGTTQWLSRGFHRLAGYKIADIPYIPCYYHIGRFEDALLDALGSNDEAALYMTPACKRKEIRMVLSVPNLACLSDRELGRRYHVSHSLVSTVRREMRGEGIEQSDTMTVNRGGKTYEAKRPQPKAKAPEQPVDASVRIEQIDDTFAVPESRIPSAMRGTEAIAPEDTEQDTADRINNIPLYQALQHYGHRGVNFKKQAQQWYATRKQVVALRNELPQSASGPYTDLVMALYNTPEPTEWTGCPTCTGSHYIGGEPCPTCKEGYVTHNNGTSAEEVAKYAPQEEKLAA